MEVSRRTALGAALGAAGAAALLPHVAVTPAAAAGSVGSYGSGVPADW